MNLKVAYNFQLNKNPSSKNHICSEFELTTVCLLTLALSLDFHTTNVMIALTMCVNQ